jgi:hypothetical protein
LLFTPTLSNGNRFLADNQVKFNTISYLLLNHKDYKTNNNLNNKFSLCAFRLTATTCTSSIGTSYEQLCGSISRNAGVCGMHHNQ